MIFFKKCPTRDVNSLFLCSYVQKTRVEAKYVLMSKNRDKSRTRESRNLVTPVIS